MEDVIPKIKTSKIAHQFFSSATHPLLGLISQNHRDPPLRIFKKSSWTLEKQKLSTKITPVILASTPFELKNCILEKYCN